MERLFRQRMEYLNSMPDPGCFLCVDAETDDLGSNLILTRSELCQVVMNRYPYNTGHLLVAPRRHTGELGNLSGEEMTELMALTVACIDVLKEAMHPEGFNIGANLGLVAGAGLPGHLHMHVVPRWSGDTNFMPVVGEAKVLPENLEQTFERLKRLFGRPE